MFLEPGQLCWQKRDLFYRRRCPVGLPPTYVMVSLQLEFSHPSSVYGASTMYRASRCMGCISEKSGRCWLHAADILVVDVGGADATSIREPQPRLGTQKPDTIPTHSGGSGRSRCTLAVIKLS